MARYQKPGWFVSRVANGALAFVIGRLGKSPAGAHLLEVRGRKSSTVQTVPVNPVTVGGNRYLVAPRGETQWVRNFRAAGEGVLRVGQDSEPIVGREVEDADKPEVLRAYLDRWYGQVKGQFGVPKDASLEQLAEIAGNHPVFHIHPKEIA
jgi:deazaflavin-dependent oxidoreductase (nitroreductase family)